MLVLRALYSSIGTRLYAGRFNQTDCYDLSPYLNGNFINRLYDQGILGDDPERASPGTYYLYEGSLRINLKTAFLFLPPDEKLGSNENAINLLFDRKFSDSESLISLWLDYACDDVTCYLMDQCNLHNQHILDNDYIKIQEVIRDGLRTYSVVQMWCIMYKVTREAASLSRRSYYNQQSATATIAAKIRKHLEIANRNGEIRDDWNRPSYQIAGTLGTVFKEAFSIDERSRGADVLYMFGQLGESQPSDDFTAELAAAFMKASLESDNSISALEAFAKMIRSGLDVENALIETVRCNPELFE